MQITMKDLILSLRMGEVSNANYYKKRTNYA